MLRGQGLHLRQIRQVLRVRLQRRVRMLRSRRLGHFRQSCENKPNERSLAYGQPEHDTRQCVTPYGETCHGVPKRVR